MRIILFDGECNFCDASVQFILKRDHCAFHFASLQSELGKKLVNRFQLHGIDSLVLIENNRAYTKSTAALRIAKQLQGLWHLCYVAIVLPKPIRDRMYDVIAKNRYKWFGKKEVCLLPSEQDRLRFLTDEKDVVRIVESGKL